MSLTVEKVISLMEALAPKKLAENWDNPGLQLGDPGKTVHRILISLDVDQAVAEEAVARGVDLIITHHPLIFHPVHHLALDQPLGKLVACLIKNDIAVFSAHTNLDSAAGGVNDILASLLELENREVLAPGYEEKLFKLAVFVPADFLGQVREAVCRAGGGWIGKYSHCTFSLPGRGTFLPLEGAHPFIGTKGELETVEEYRLETVVPENKLPEVVQAMINSHPYEEVAYDVYPLALAGTKYGLGRVGELKSPASLRELAQKVKNLLGAEAVKVIGHPEQRIEKVALCGGAGISLIKEAKMKGAQCLITGDVKYHEGQNALAREMAVLDPGHYATEAVVVPHLASRLQREVAALNFAGEILLSKVNTNPWWFFVG